MNRSLLSQQRTTEQKTSATTTTVRETRTRGQETRVAQQSFSSQQQSTVTSQRVQGALLQQHQQQQLQHQQQQQMITSGGRGADGSPPVFDEIFRNARFAQGGNASFEGRVRGNPVPEVSWTRQGQPLYESNKYRMSYDETTGRITLQINNIGPNDEGEYTCTAINQFGEAICTVFIQPEGESRDWHEQEKSQLLAKQSAPADVRVQRSTGSYMRTQYEKTTTSDGRVEQQSQRKTSSEVAFYSNGNVEEFKVDTFEYRLLREAEFREAVTRRTPAELQAEPEPEPEVSAGPLAPPQVVQKPRNTKLLEGSDATFQTKLAGNPKAKVTWFRNGVRIRPSPRHEISHSNQMATLKIRMILPEDSGHYTLFAENPKGCIVSTAYLAVEPVGTRDEMEYRSSRSVEQPREPRSMDQAPSAKLLRTASHTAQEPIMEPESPGKALAPAFARVPPDQEVGEGKMARFDCRVTGRPYPEVLWYLNGQQLCDDATHKILINESGNHSLMITSTQLSDSGVISCVARNKGGEASFQCRLSVIEKERVVSPKFVERFTTTHVKEGEPVFLHARAVGTPVPKLTWQKDGVPISSGDNLIINSDGGYSTLEIPSAHIQDSAWYQCTAQNAAGSTATRARLYVETQKSAAAEPRRLHFPKPTKVIEPEPEPEPEVIYLRHVERSRPQAPRKEEEERSYEPPVFVLHLKDANLSEGQRAYFEAKVNPVGDPTMRVEWFIDGKPLAASSRVTTTYRFGYISLSLIGVIREDSGVYTCRVINEAGYAESTARMIVGPRATIESTSQHPESLEQIQMLEDYSRYQRSTSIEETVNQAPVFVKPLRDLGAMNEGTYAHLEAQIQPVGDSQLRIEWFKDGRSITASSRITTVSNFGYIALNITHLRAEDTGTYMVRISNRLGEATSSAKITVVSRSGVTGDLGIPEQQRYIERIEELEAYQLQLSQRGQPEAIEATTPPVFRSPIKDQLDIREGGFAYFEARLDPIGDPKLRVDWLKDGKPLEASSRITSFFNFGYIALTIKHITVLDRGVYTCVARNALGEATASANLTVISKKDILLDSQHPEGLEKIRYLEDDSRYARTVKEDTTVTIKPRFLGQLKGTTKIVEGQRAHFEARVEPQNDNTLTVEWYFNGKVLMQASRIHIFHDFGYVALDILDVRAEDAGTYTVVARNALGEAQSSATMQVETRSSIDTTSMHRGGYEKIQRMEGSKFEEPHYEIEEISKSRPIFVIPLNDPKPTAEGKNVHLECRLEPMGDPTMRVEWFFNGKPVTVGSRFKTYYDFGFVALDIIGVTTLDSGEYTVRATNHLGTAHTSAAVRIIGRSDILTDAQHEGAWEQIQMLEDSSRYNRRVEEEVSIEQAPAFKRPLQNIETIEGTNIHLECRLIPVGDPSMRVDWLVNGTPIRTGHRFRPAFDFDYVALDILSVYPEDSGVYTCRAYNKLGEAVTSASVKVIAKSELILESQHPAGLQKIQYLEDASRYKRQEEVDETYRIKPRFLTKPKPQEGLREGQNAHFECKLEPVADPNLKVEWFRDGLPITVGHRFRPIHDFGYVALDIIGVIAEDTATYTCRAVNLVGSDETSVSLSCKSVKQIVTEAQHEVGMEKLQYLEDRSRYQRAEEVEEVCTQAPVFTTSLKNMEIKEGQRAHFECRLIPVSDATMKVEWFHNKTPVKSGSRFSETNSFGFVALDILHTYPEDSGVYTCRATNALGESVTSCQLLVQSKKSILSETQHQSALSQIQQLEDDSKYKRASFIEESTTQAPVFTQPMKDVQLTENQHAHFEARLIPVGDPRLKIEWYKNGVPLSDASRITTMHDFGFVSLDMKYVYPEDSGTYSCRAVNDIGEAVTSATLVVTSKASLITDSQHKEVAQKMQLLEGSSRYQRTEIEDVLVTSAPKFVTPLNGTSRLVEGQNTHLECRIEPYPDPTLKVEWFHNGKVLQSGHRFRTVNDFGFASLDILSVYPEDSGEYTIKATNKLGTVTSTLVINVAPKAGLILESQNKAALDKIQYLEDDSRYRRVDEVDSVITDKPSFGRPLRNLENLIEGQSAHLEATLVPVNDPNMRVEWYHNGRPISQGHRFRTNYDFGFVSLDILYVYPEDSGTYMCKAINANGEAVTTCSVQVKGQSNLVLDTLDRQRLEKITELESYAPPPKEEVEVKMQRPVFVTPLVSLENLKEGDRAHLECRLEPVNDPNLTVEWYVNGVAIKAGHRFRTTHDFGYVALDILYAYQEDSGTYMCKAINKLGEAVSTCTINVASRHNILLDTQHPDGLEKIRALESQGRPARPEIEDAPTGPPRFVTELQGTTRLVEGQTAHFECRVEPTRDPKLRIEVYHNGKLLQSAARFHVTHDFGYVAVDIKHVYPEDSGTYTVRAVNDFGECVTSINVQVEGKSGIISESQHPGGLDKIRELEDASRYRKEAYIEPKTFQRPVFTAPLQNLDNVTEGGNAHLECRLIPVGDPTLKVDWFRNEQPLEDSSRIQKTHDFGYVALDITHVRAEDEGIYMCRATNSLGEAVTTASVRIRTKSSILLESQHPEGMRKIRELEEGKYNEPAPEQDRVFDKPVFSAALTGPAELIEGQHAHFECRVLPVGDPSLRFEWFVNGVELKLGSRFRVTHDFGFVTLDISDVIPEDSGVYMCKAINKSGEAISTASMKVRPRGSIYGDAMHPQAWEKIQLRETELLRSAPQPEDVGPQEAPRFVKHLVNHDSLTESQNLHLEAQVEPKTDPNLRIEWYRNGVQLMLGSRIQSTFDFGLVSLDITGLRPDDSGIYMCRAVNRLGEAVSTCTIKVNERGWLLGQSLRPEALSKIEALEAPRGHDVTDMDVTYESPVFITHLNNVECREGETAHFECRVEPSKDPTMRIEWYLNGKQLPMASRFNAKYDFGYVSLDISHVYAEDSGVYTCRAVNNKGEAVSTGTLRCSSKANIYLDTQHPQGKSGLEKVQEAEEAYYAKYHRQSSVPDATFPKPLFIVPLEEKVSVAEGQQIHLECRVEPKQDPKLRVEWFFNGKLLDHGSRFRVNNDFGFVSLDFSDVYVRDQGVYTCRASNAAGEAFTSTTIYCTGKRGLIEDTQHPKGEAGLEKIQRLEESLLPQEGFLSDEQGHAPVFTSQFQNVTNLLEGDIAHFEATLTPVGDQSMVVEWFYNGQPLKLGHRERTVFAFGMVVLEILGTKIEDSGLYTCRATNKWGSAEISVTLECIDPSSGQKPQFTSQLKNIEGLKDGDSAHFECTLVPVGDPNLKVEWFHNGQPLRHSSRIKTVCDFGFVVMDIAYVQSHDSGEYICKASNKFGEDFTRATLRCFGKGGVYSDSLQPDSLAKIRALEEQDLTAAPTAAPVAEAPKFVTPLQNVSRLVEGQSAHFEARLTPVNDPLLTVEWYFNGKKLPSGHRFRTFHDFGIVILDILYCYEEDSGVYECRAVNQMGQDVTRATLTCVSKASLILDTQLPKGLESLQKIQTLEESFSQQRAGQVEDVRRQAPVFTVPLNNVVGLKEGENAHFEGRLTPVDDPKLKVEWFFNGKPLKTGSRIRTFCDFGFVVLEISPVYPEDSGEYSCRASNEAGEAVTSAVLKCQGKRNIILDSQLPKGMERTFERIAELEGLGAVPTEQAPEVDSGKPPEFVKAPTNLTLQENATAHFECQVTPVGDPSLRVEWFHNGKAILAGSRVKTINDFGFVILEISGVYQRDAGLYTCKATNKHGEASVTCTLQVKSRQGIVLEPQLPQHFKSGTESIQKLEESLYKRDDIVQAEEEQPNPPRFITEIKDILDLAEGQPAHFDCRVEPVGDASMRIEWFHNGRPLATGSRIHMIDDFGFVVLDIGWTFPRDAGEYTCRATNRWGTATTHAKLVVKGKRDVNVESQLPQGRAAEKLRDLERGTVEEKIEKDLPAEPPRFIIQLVSADTEEGENTHFECRVEPKNDPNLRIEWYHNGRPLQTGHRFRTLYELGYISLDILYTYAEDAGEYVCRARNTAGEDATKAVLSCKGGPGIIMQNQMPRGMKKSETFAQMETALRKYTNQIFLTEEDIYDADRKQPPRFVTHIQDQLDLKEMETTKFECQLAPVGDPNMKIEWFFNGKPLPYKTRFTPIYDFGYVAMDFGWVYPEDSGEYVCRATNLYGSDETKAVIKSTGRPGIIYDSQLPKGMQSVEKIREMEAAWQRMPDEPVEGEKQAEAPVFVMKPESAQVSEGEWARFCCRVSGFPRPRVMWILNGHTVINGTRYKLTYDGMWHLDIPKTRQYDDGKLEVIARNSVGEAVCTVELKVVPSKNDYRSVLKNSPKPWYDNDLRAYQDERSTELRRKFDERTTATGSVEAADVIRRRAVQETETEWQQQLKKKKQEEYYRSLRELEESQVTKEVKLKESSHQFAIPGEKVVQKSMAKGMAQSYQTKLEKESVETTEGTQTLTRVSGESATAISRKVSEGHRSEVHIDSQRGGVPPDPYESSVHGREVHVATQKQTQKEVKGAMEITRKITATETTEVEHKARTQERVVKGQVAPSKPPYFTKKIQPCRVFEHESARFEVEFDGEPTPTVTWFREDFPIKNSPEFQIHTFGTKSVLIIRQVFMEDSGIFAAVAENRGGAAKCSANLVVEERRQGRGGIVPPSFLTTIQDVTVKAGQVIRLDAKLTGTRPMDIYWLKNGRKLSSEIRYKILEEDGVHTLMIIEADADDSGVYECVAINKAGEARCEAQCYVEPSPPASAATSPEVVKGKITAPRISQPIKDQNVMEGQPAVFRCRAVGNPAPQVTWEKGGQPIKPSRYFIMSQEGDTHILRISEAFPEDEGTYKCVASNSAGQAQCSANLKVKVPESVEVPPTLTPLEDITVVEGTPVQFRTVVSGKPTPTVQWLREGALIPPSADFQMMQEGNHAVLLIKTTYPEDSGVFTCRATNPASQTESSAYLTVLSKQ